MKVKKKSALTGVEHTRDIPIRPDDYESWEQGYGNIRECMPYLNETDRTFILSGITDTEWSEFFRNSVEKASTKVFKF